MIFERGSMSAVTLLRVISDAAEWKDATGMAPSTATQKRLASGITTFCLARWHDEKDAKNVFVVDCAMLVSSTSGWTEIQAAVAAIVKEPKQ